MKDVPQVYAKDRATWRQWLEKNHDKEKSVWLVFDKGKNRTLSWTDIVQENLCFGWIDGQAGSVSDTQSKIYVSRRRPKSGWSKINKQHVDDLIAAGLMTPSGQSVIDEAKRNGTWDILNKSDALEIPPELQKLFTKHPTAQKNFEAFSNSSKRVILEWIYAAKKEETTMIRINETFEAAKNNQKVR